MNSVVGVFSFPETAHEAQVCRAVSVLFNTCVGCHHGSEAGGGGFESRYRPYSLRLLRYSLTCSHFLTAKIGVFLTKTQGFLLSGLFFLKNYTFSDVTEKKLFFFNIF